MNEFKVGLLAIATMAAVVFMSLKITSNQSGFGKYVTYKTIIKDASGIFPKTPIKIAGIPAGRISEIDLEDNAAHITFEILDRIKVTKNSKLSIKAVGFLGDKYLEIHIGDSPEIMAPNDFIDSLESPGMESMIKDASEVLVDVRSLVKTFKDIVAPDGKTSPLKKMVDDMQLLVENAKDVSVTLKRLAVGNEDKINSLVENFENLSYELSSQLDKNNPESALVDLKEILNNTKKMTAEMNEIIVNIKNGKGTIGKFLAEDEIADQVKETLSSVQKIVGKADALRTELSVFSGVNSDNGSESEMSLRIHPSPERFYHLGISSANIGPPTETITERTTNGSTTVENKKRREADTFRFNVQIGRRVQDFTFRGGLIESTGGFGIDYFLQSLGTKFSLEGFDYAKDRGANLRFITELQIWNILYGRASFNNMNNKDRSATIQAGLRFNDEDLKGLLGFFL